MNPTPPPLSHPNRGFLWVLLASLFPAAVGLALSWVIPQWWNRSAPACLAVAASLALPAWMAWRLHRQRKAAGVNIFPYGWLAVGAGVLGAVLLSVMAVVLSVIVVFLVVLAACCATGGKIGG